MSRCMPEGWDIMVYAVERSKISDGYGVAFLLFVYLAVL